MRPIGVFIYRSFGDFFQHALDYESLRLVLTAAKTQSARILLINWHQNEGQRLEIALSLFSNPNNYKYISSLCCCIHRCKEGLSNACGGLDQTDNPCFRMAITWTVQRPRGPLKTSRSAFPGHPSWSWTRSAEGARHYAHLWTNNLISLYHKHIEIGPVDHDHKKCRHNMARIYVLYIV